MKEIFDPVEAIFELIEAFYFESGQVPTAVVLSPHTYRRLLEIRSDEFTIGNLVIGCAPITIIATPWGDIQVVLDELMEDTRVGIEK
jgi:hypothetical protein